jgi:hypothetical protein
MSAADALREFADLPLWLVWRNEKRGGRPTKVPYSPVGGGHASSTDPSTWGTREQAERGSAGFDGVGIMLAPLDEGRHLGGIDLDACIDDEGNVAPWAREIVERVASYTEISPSYRGLKIFFEHDPRETLAKDAHWHSAVRQPSLDGGKGRGVEFYLRARYFTVTDNTFEQFGTVRLVDFDTLRDVQCLMEAFGDKPKPPTHHPHRHDDDQQRLFDALASIPGEDDYNEWVRIGMALHADVQGSPEGYRAFVAWSTKSSKFDARHCEQKWREWDRKPADHLTAGTIFYIARQNGWQDPRQEAKSNGAAIAIASNVKREPPRPLTRPVAPAAEYPINALEPGLAAAARALEARTQAPLALCAQAVLSAASLASQGHRDVEMPGGLLRPLSEYFLVIALSGERKTTADGFALKSVREVERELQTQYALDLAAFKNKHAAWEQVRKPAGKVSKDKTAALADLTAAGDEPTPPRKPFILVSEPTPEGLVKLLADGQPSVGLFSAEASTFIGGHGMSDESRLRTAGVLSRLWDDGSADRVRGGDGAMKIYNRRLTISLATQPGNGLEWLASPVLADQGFFSRLLVVAPTSRIGSRCITSETEARVRETQDDLVRFHARIKKLLEAVPEGAELKPAPLRLSPTAHELWRDFSNVVEGEMAPRGSLANVRPISNKANEHALRLAGILTVYRNLNATKIDAETVVNAIELVKYYLDEAARVSGMAVASEGSRRAQETLDFLRGLDHDVVHLAEIYQRGPSSVRNAATARAVMQMLTDHGYVEPIPDGAEVDGGHRREAWRVLPPDGEVEQ